MNAYREQKQACACDCCSRVLFPDDYEHQEHLRIDFKAGYASVFGDGNTVQAVLCQHCVQKHLGPWLTIIEESDDSAVLHDAMPRHAYQPYQLRARGPVTDAHETLSEQRDGEGGWFPRIVQRLLNLPLWVLMLASGALLTLFLFISMSPQFERAQLVLSAEGCQAMAAHAVATDPLPDSELCRISGLYDRGKLASKTATIRVEGESGPIEVRLSHAQIVSHASQ